MFVRSDEHWLMNSFIAEIYRPPHSYPKDHHFMSVIVRRILFLQKFYSETTGKILPKCSRKAQISALVNTAIFLIKLSANLNWSCLLMSYCLILMNVIYICSSVLANIPLEIFSPEFTWLYETKFDFTIIAFFNPKLSDNQISKMPMTTINNIQYRQLFHPSSWNNCQKLPQIY